MTHGSLFSGIGGFDLAAEWAGWENVFHCEWNEFGKRLLSHYWPNAKSYDDITKTDFTLWRGRVDVLSGGFPCQPYSQAGKRLGKEDERHLWPEMLRAIREIEPTWVVGENVRGLVNWNGGMVFDEVQADLEANGYEVLPFILPACGKDAPHRRDRVWFVAYSEHSRHQAERGATQETDRIQGKHWQEMDGRQFDGTSVSRPTSNAPSKRSERLGIGQQPETCSTKQIEFGGGNREGATSDASNTRLQGNERHREDEVQNISGREGTSRSVGQFYRCSGFKQFPTQSPICGGDDGLPTELDGITFPKWRNESIKAYGNAVVPQVVYEIFKVINQYNREAEML